MKHILDLTFLTLAGVGLGLTLYFVSTPSTVNENLQVCINHYNAVRSDAPIYPKERP
jgi:hypothetical protein